MTNATRTKICRLLGDARQTVNQLRDAIDEARQDGDPLQSLWHAMVGAEAALESLAGADADLAEHFRNAN